MNTEKDLLAKKVVAHMMEHDLFSKWLGIEVLEIKEGYSKIKMTVRKEMTLSKLWSKPDIRELLHSKYFYFKAITTWET